VVVIPLIVRSIFAARPVGLNHFNPALFRSAFAHSLSTLLL
jgi:hypothetical protein